MSQERGAERAAASDRAAWLAAFAGTLALIALLATSASADPDLGFHLATGRAVIASGGIPRTNVLTFAEPEHPWINQQWLPATMFALAFDRAGFAGTWALRLAFVLATAAFLLAAARRLGARPEVAAGVVLLGAWAAAFRFVERPLLASNLALAIVVWACAAAWSEPGRARRFVVVAALAASLAIHLHAGALFSLVALAAFAVALALEPLAARVVGREPGVDASTARAGAASLVLALLAAIALAGATLALYHPYGLRVLLVPLQMASDRYLGEHLVEFRSPFDQPLRVLWPYWAFVAAALVVVVASWRRAPLPFAIAIALGITISLRHARFADLAWILGAPAIAALASPLLAARRPVALGAIAIAALAIADRTAIAPLEIGASPAVWPRPLFDAIASSGVVGPAYVQDGWAGPFLARFWPRERVFFHPAFEAYSEAHFRRYQSIRYAEPGWEHELRDVQLVVMKHTSERERAFQHGAPNLRQRLAERPEWALLAFDELGAVWVRRDGANAARVHQAPSFVDPDRMELTRAPRVACAGLDHLAQREPRSIRLVALLAVSCADAGQRARASALLDEAERIAPGDPRIAMARSALSRL